VLRWKGVPLSTQKLEILKAVMEGTPIPNSGGPSPLEDLSSFGDIALSKNVSAAAPSLSQTSEVHQPQKTSGALRTLLPPNQMLDTAEVTARSICTMQRTPPRSIQRVHFYNFVCVRQVHLEKRVGAGAFGEVKFATFPCSCGFV
jgi:hypothetical protein